MGAAAGVEHVEVDEQDDLTDLALAEHEVEDLAKRLGFPHLAKKKTTLSDWRKAAGL